ncbi:MAG: L-serine ammonia-lyase, iron-sulfur-dependent subunit beta [Treponema sp.]|jgi:L-serine dehydratase|nr:L-serine ammonia-lyase, iron-sulfur-dependent subunit beta [Treponema sp.]
MPKEQVLLCEIFGPVMIGPSSSHTAGVSRIAFLARKIFGTAPQRAVIRFYGSLAATWKGHGSGDAAVAGLLGIPPEDERLFRGRALLVELQAAGKGFPLAIETAAELPPSWHPNSVVLELYGGHTLIIQGSSIGGGSIRIDAINGYGVHLSGESEAILVLHYDEIGVIAEVTHILAAHHINIAATSSHRKERGGEALLVVETDSPIPVSVITQIQKLSSIYRVLPMPALTL